MVGIPKIRVLIADDDAGLREALADTVRSTPDLEIVGSVGDATEAVREAEMTQPDVVLMDVRMPGGGGVVATRQVLRMLSDVQVVALSALEEKEAALEMLDAGACAYVVKGVSESEIVEAIRRAHRGQMSLPTDLGTASIRHLLRRLSEKDQTEEVRRNDLKRLAMLDAGTADREAKRQRDRFARSILESTAEHLAKTGAHSDLLVGTRMAPDTTTTTGANPPDSESLKAKKALRNRWSARAGVALRVGVILVAYYGSARVGLSLSFEHSNVTPVWPPSGAAVAALVLLGGRYWPALAAGAFLVNLTTGLPTTVALGFAVGNTLEYIAAAWLLRRMRFRPSLHRLRDVALLALAGVVSPPIAATVGTGSLYWGHIIPTGTVPTVLATYWIGDGVGIIIFTPLILVWMPPWGQQIGRARVAESMALIAAVMALSWLVFLDGVPFLYLIFALAIWASVRFGQRGITATIVLTAVVAIAGTVRGDGPFNESAINDRLANLEVFLAALALTGLALAAAVLSRRESEEQLRASTTELEATNRELEAFTQIVSHDLRAPLRAIDVVRGLLESAPDAMVILDPHGTVQVVNAQTEVLFGYLRGELSGQSVDILVPERFRPSHSSHRKRYVSQPVTRPMGVGLDLFGRRKDGSEFPIDISLSPMETEDGVLIIAAVRDVTDRQEAMRQLSELAARLGAAQEEERLRIASDIHDDTIQAMTATSLRMQQLRRHLTDDGQVAMLSKLEEATHESIVRLRRLMFDLRPASLDIAGLAPALRELLERLHEESSITFTLDNHLVTELAAGVRTSLYRIAQEALVNVRKHSAATTVQVELSEVSGGCKIKISDNGRGFDPQQAESNHAHFGLVAMRERAKIAGGWWKVHCPPAGGTVVEFWLPIAAGAAIGRASGVESSN